MFVWPRIFILKILLLQRCLLNIISSLSSTSCLSCRYINFFNVTPGCRVWIQSVERAQSTIKSSLLPLQLHNYGLQGYLFLVCIAIVLPKLPSTLLHKCDSLESKYSYLRNLCSFWGSNLVVHFTSAVLKLCWCRN